MSPGSDPAPEARALPPGESGSGLAPGPASGTLAPPEPSRVYAFPPDEEEAHFWDYWRVIVRHRWTVITVFVASLIIGTVWTYTTRPVFIATATLRIEKEEPKIVQFEQVLKTGSEQDFYQTQYKLLQSRTLAHRVIGLLHLDEHPEFQSPTGDGGWVTQARAWARAQMVRWIPVPPPPVPEIAAGSDDLPLPSPVTSAFLSRLSVAPDPGTRLVRVSFSSHYPALTARVANTLAEAFITYNLDHKLETSRYASRFLTGQLEEARRRLEAADDKLNQFLTAHDMLINPDKAGERLDLVTKQLLEITTELQHARTERITKESLMVQALSRDPDSLPAVLDSRLVGKLKEELLSLQAEYRKLGQTFRPEYPRMQRLEEGINEVRRQLRGEVARVVEALEAEYQTARRKEEELQKAVDESRGLARQLGNSMTRYTLLRRDVESSHEQYSSLLTRLKEIGVSSALVTSPISVVDRAEIPTAPSEPRPQRSLLFATVVGLFGGIGLAFFFEYLDTNIKDAREVEAVLRVPTLGVVPSQAALESRRARRRRHLAEGDEEAPFALVAHTDMGSVLAEAFRNLRTSLLYSAPEHPPKSLIVTSLQPEDGKTSLAANLAITLAQLGNGEVLLVDGDLRRPALHEIFELPKIPGLSTFLTGQAELPAVLRPTRIPNLHVIPAGRTPTNPAELMASARLSRALEVLQERFTHIVFDAPPLFGVSDAMILAPRVEGVVLVLRHGRASRDAARRALQLLASVRARLLGVVLNDVNVRGAGYYDYYGYYGYYGYGYGGSPQSEA